MPGGQLLEGPGLRAPEPRRPLRPVSCRPRPIRGDDQLGLAATSGLDRLAHWSTLWATSCGRPNPARTLDLRRLRGPLASAKHANLDRAAHGSAGQGNPRWCPLEVPCCDRVKCSGTVSAVAPSAPRQPPRIPSAPATPVWASDSPGLIARPGLRRGPVGPREHGRQRVAAMSEILVLHPNTNPIRLPRLNAGVDILPPAAAGARTLPRMATAPSGTGMTAGVATGSGDHFSDRFRASPAWVFLSTASAALANSAPPASSAPQQTPARPSTRASGASIALQTWHASPPLTDP